MPLPPVDTTNALRAQAKILQARPHKDRTMEKMEKAVKNFTAMFLEHQLAPMFQQGSDHSVAGRMYRSLQARAIAHKLAESSHFSLSTDIMKELTRLQGGHHDG